MPKLKVNNVVSFSTEDPVHTANNILLNDSNKKWKCRTTGEKSASVILQLETPSKISGIDIGNEHSAYIEVLVSRSSNSDDDFQVLLVMSSFMSPLESKQSTNINKVRMFSYQELQSPERDQKWDRIKIVCTQPFNRHVQYGLSFITLHASDSKDNGDNTPGKLGNFLIRPKSPDNLSIGSLFARRKELTNDPPPSAAVAIREASASSSSSLKQHLAQCKPKLKDGTVARKDKAVVSNNSFSSASKARNRDELLYSAEEEKPNAKIDKLIEDKNKEAREKQLKNEEEGKKKASKKTDSNILDSPSTSSNSSSSKTFKKLKDSKDSTRRDSKDANKRKLNGNDTPKKKMKVDKVCKPFNELLRGVTIVISGIQNPERADIRSNALAMGAKYKADWDDTCTHLICAFANTPKFNQVRGKGKIVNKHWISTCYSQRKRIPWRRHALDNKDQSKDESEDEIWELNEKSPEVEVVYSSKLKDEDDSDDVDTEDEIERIQALEKIKNQSRNEHEEGCYSVDTDEEVIEVKPKGSVPELPDFLSNKVLYIDTELDDSTKSVLVRYITAFKGILVDEPSDIVDYAISSQKFAEMLGSICPDAIVVSPGWVWECHNSRTLVPIEAATLSPNTKQLSTSS